MVSRPLLHGIVLLVYTLAFCVFAPAGPCCPCKDVFGESRCSTTCDEALEECSCSAHGTAKSGEAGCSAHEHASGGCADGSGGFAPLPCRCALHTTSPSEKEYLAESNVRAGRADPLMTVPAFDTGFGGLLTQPDRMAFSSLPPPGGAPRHRCLVLII